MSVEVAERLRGWKFRRRETLLEGIFGDGREWRSTQAITVDLVLDGTSFGGDVKVLHNISLQILPELCVDIVIGVDAIVTYNLFAILEQHLRSSIEDASSVVALTLTETEDLEVGVGELQEAFPLEDNVEDTLKILNDAISTELTPEEWEAQRLLILKFSGCFNNELQRKSECKIPPMHVVRLEKLWDESAVRAMRLKARRQCPEHNAEIDKQVSKLLQRGFIEECNAEFYSQVLLVRKQDKSFRLCTDYRQLNKLTMGYSWPLPDIKFWLQQVAGNQYYAVLDCTQGYHQLSLTTEASWLTAFITNTGMYRWKRVPFGLKGAPSYFQQAMQSLVLKDLVGKDRCCCVYIDDVIIFGRTWERYMSNLHKVLERFQTWGVLLKVSKCRFAVREAKFLGHIVSKNGFKLEDEER